MKLRTRILLTYMLTFICLGLVYGVAADPVNALPESYSAHTGPSSTSLAALKLKKIRVLGINYHQLDDHTRLLGWRLHPDWYFGRSRGESSEVALIWRTNTQDQFSLSKDGLRFQHRF